MARSSGSLTRYTFLGSAQAGSVRPARQSVEAGGRMGRRGSNRDGGAPMGEKKLRTGKQVRPKTAVKGNRYLCARCRKRSPRPVMTPAPWYCPNCLKGTAVSPDADTPGPAS